ncbi:unnamed protein product [Schistosoma curassoni]|uniref:GtrA family protein n=1 Tax=Schistosoma curassoni TaxID=6186 RepID=A0A183JQV0_9TREM|nr:unnamed protein product [Schistosoma curassoni]
MFTYKLSFNLGKTWKNILCDTFLNLITTLLIATQVRYLVV